MIWMHTSKTWPSKLRVETFLQCWSSLKQSPMASIYSKSWIMGQISLKGIKFHNLGCLGVKVNSWSTQTCPSGQWFKIGNSLHQCNTYKLRIQIQLKLSIILDYKNHYHKFGVESPPVRDPKFRALPKISRFPLIWVEIFMLLRAFYHHLYGGKRAHVHDA